MPFIMTKIFQSAHQALLVIGVALALPVAASAADTRVAVATNFTEPSKEIAAAFQKATGHTATLVFGASGAFYTQIAHGAPFEVFLSADADRPKKAEQDGLTVRGTRFTYAVGRLMLYSTTLGLIDDNGAVLKRGNFNKIALADPLVAPYGVAAVQTMQSMNVYSALEPKIVKGSSLTQAYQFSATGAAELGFVAYSQVIAVQGGSRWLVPAKLHKPIEQQAVLLLTGAHNPAALAFVKFMRSPQAVKIIKRYGYETGRSQK